MDIGRVLKDSWTIFARDWGALVVAALITFVLGVLTLGILSVPLTAGLYLMILRRVREGRQAQVGDVFGCFDRLGAYVVAYLLFLALRARRRRDRPAAVPAAGRRPFRARARLGVVLFVLAVCVVTVVGAYLLTDLGLLDDPHGRQAALGDRGAQREPRDRHRERFLDDPARSSSWSGASWAWSSTASAPSRSVSAASSRSCSRPGSSRPTRRCTFRPPARAPCCLRPFRVRRRSGRAVPRCIRRTGRARTRCRVSARRPGPYGPPPGYVPPPPGYAPPPPATRRGHPVRAAARLRAARRSPSGYAPPAGPPPGYAPPAGSPTPQAPPWVSAPTAPPPWVQTPAWGQPPAQAAPPSSPPQSGPATPDAALAGQSPSETATSPETAQAA